MNKEAEKCINEAIAKRNIAQYDEAIDCYTSAIGHLSDDGICRAKCLIGMAECCIQNREEDTAFYYYEQAEKIFLEEQADEDVARCYYYKACLLLGVGNKEGAYSLFFNAELIFAKNNNLEMDAYCLFNIANICRVKKIYDEAYSYYEQCLTVFAEGNIDNIKQIMLCHYFMSKCLLAYGKTNSALTEMSKAIEIARQNDYGELLRYEKEYNELQEGDDVLVQLEPRGTAKTKNQLDDSAMREETEELINDGLNARRNEILRNADKERHKYSPVFLSQDGDSERNRGEYRKAIVNYANAVRRYGMREGNDLNIALIYVKMAFCFSMLSNKKDEHKYNKMALDIFKELDNNRGATQCCSNMAASCIKSNDFEGAETLYRQALKYADMLDDECGYDKAVVLYNLGKLYISMKKPENAKKCLRAAYRIFKDNDFKEQLAEIEAVLLTLPVLIDDSVDKEELGVVLEYMDAAKKHIGERDIKGAVRLYAKAIECAKNANVGNAGILGEIYTSLGNCYRVANLLEKSKACYTKAISIFKENADTEKMACTMSNLALTYYKLEDLENTERAYLEAIKLFQNSNAKGEKYAEACYNLGKIMIAQKELDKAKKLFAVAKGVFESSGTHESEIKLINKILKKK